MPARTTRVSGRAIGPGEPIFLTAEIGCSHMGDFQAAKEMLLGAKRAACDAADLFLASPEDFYAASAPHAIEEWRREGLSPDEWRQLFRYAEDIGLILYLTPLDLPSVRMAVELGAPMLNVNSDDVNNPAHLELVGSTGLPVSMHDIGATLAEVEAAVQVLSSAGCRDIILLHSTLEAGTSERYYATANLRVMDTYRAAFSGKGVLVGCVEHTSSDFLIYAVAALEPVLISKHIIVRHTEGAPDDEISVDLHGLQDMVRNVRLVESALGSGANCVITDINGRMPPSSESRRKILVAARDIPQGKTIDKQDIVAKRPWAKGGLHPWKMRELYGAKAARAIARDEVLTLNMFADLPAVDYKFPAPDEFRCETPGR